jgi:hypothetical protein
MFYIHVEWNADGDDLPRDFNDFEASLQGSGE